MASNSHSSPENSDYEAEVDESEIGHTQEDTWAYRYEPYASDSGSERQSDESNDEDSDHGVPVDIGRLQNTEWCNCAHCQNMLTVDESICCTELERIRSKMEDQNIEGCITTHPGFQSVCLDVWVLQTAYFAYKQENGHMAQNQVNERYRYTAYRQFVRWCWGYLGRNIRVPLPAFVVSKIRESFPSADYQGFAYPNLG